MSDPICCDCAGWDVEWMYQCKKHPSFWYCRGCECTACHEEDDEDYDYEDAALGKDGGEDGRA